MLNKRNTRSNRERETHSKINVSAKLKLNWSTWAVTASTAGYRLASVLNMWGLALTNRDKSVHWINITCTGIGFSFQIIFLLSRSVSSGIFLSFYIMFTYTPLIFLLFQLSTITHLSVLLLLCHYAPASQSFGCLLSFVCHMSCEKDLQHVQK